jgi:hypothetical protein
MCGANKAIVRIIAPLSGDMQEIEVVKLVKIKEGYFEGGWDWKHTGWTIPKDIPIGEYKAVFEVTSSAGTSKKDKKFFVAFDHKEIRNNIVAATPVFSKNTFGCHTPCWVGGPPICCSSKERGRGLNESEVNSFFKAGSPPWDVDCTGAARIIMARGLILTLKNGEFDKLKHDSSNMHYNTSNMNIELKKPVANIGQMKIGDWGYFENHDSYPDKHPCGAYPGENVIKVSTSKYYGFPSKTPKTYKEWLKKLIDAYNLLPNTCDKNDPRYMPKYETKQINSIYDIPGFLADEIKFFDVIQVSVDVWNLRKNP